MEDLKKSWKSTLVGFIVIGMSIYHYFQTGQADWSGMVTLLAGVGFLFTKDATDSHTKR